MNSLANMVTGNEAFETTSVNETTLVKEYFERNERKKEDEKWLKANKAKIESVLARNDRSKMDFGNIRVSVVVPDTSKFDPEKLESYLMDNNHMSALAVKYEIIEEELASLIEQGVIDLDEVKAAAWVESTGTPRLTVSKVKRGE